MRRQGGGGGGGSGGGGGGGGHYGGDSNNPQQTHMQQQQKQSKSEHNHNQWRWERDGSKVQSPMSPHIFNEGQGNEASRPYYQGQRSDPRVAMEKQGSHDARSQPRGDEMDTRYEENPLLHTFDGLEQKFLNDIMKLSKEQNDAEDAEITRHRERINAINAQHQEQLVALRAQHANRRDEFLRRESHSRQQQYQQASVDHYPSGGGLGPGDPQGYKAVAAPPREPAGRSYNADNYDTHRERGGRFPGNSRNQEPEPRVQYTGGRVYDTGSRYY